MSFTTLQFLVKSVSRFNVKRANFQNFPGGMLPDPLVGAYQVCFAYYASYIAQHLIKTPIFNVATMAKINLEIKAG